MLRKLVLLIFIINDVICIKCLFIYVDVIFFCLLVLVWSVLYKKWGM